MKLGRRILFAAGWVSPVAAHPDLVSYYETQGNASNRSAAIVYGIAFVATCALSALGIYFGRRDNKKTESETKPDS